MLDTQSVDFVTGAKMSPLTSWLRLFQVGLRMKLEVSWEVGYQFNSVFDSDGVGSFQTTKAIKNILVFFND